MEIEGFWRQGHTLVTQTVDNRLIHNILFDRRYSQLVVCESGCVMRFSPVTWQRSVHQRWMMGCSDAPVELQYVAHDPSVLPGIHVTLFHIVTKRDKMFCSGYITGATDVIALAPKRAVIVLGSFRPGSTGGSFGQLASFFFFFLKVLLLPARSLIPLCEFDLPLFICGMKGDKHLLYIWIAAENPLK